MKNMWLVLVIWALSVCALFAEKQSVEIFPYVSEGEKPSENFLGKTLTRNLVLELRRLDLFIVTEADTPAATASQATFSIRGWFIGKDDGLTFETRIFDFRGKTIHVEMTRASFNEQMGVAIEAHRAAVIQNLMAYASRKDEAAEESLLRRIHYNPFGGYGWVSASNSARKSLADSFYAFGMNVNLPLSQSYKTKSHFVLTGSGSYSLATRTNFSLTWLRGGVGYAIRLGAFFILTPEILAGVVIGKSDYLHTDTGADVQGAVAIFALTYAMSLDVLILEKLALVLSANLSTHYEKDLFLAAPLITGGVRFRW
jgi:hypothetical protein